MAQPTITPRADDAERMARAIQRVAFATGRAVGEVIIQATIMAAQSAAKATPESKKNRKVIDYTRMGRKKRTAQGIPEWAAYGVVRNDDGKVRTVFVKSRARADKVKAIYNRGIAKRAWTRSLGRIGGRPAAGRTIGGSSEMTVTREGGIVRGTSYENRIKYLSKIAPNAPAIGIAAAASRLANMKVKITSAAKSAVRGDLRVV